MSGIVPVVIGTASALSLDPVHAIPCLAALKEAKIMTAGEDEVNVLMIEPKTMVNTGNAAGAWTVVNPEQM